MSFLDFFSDLLFPPHCIACGTRCKRDLTDPCEVPFCEACRLAWEKEKTETCLRCGKELLSCRCASGNMSKAGIDESIKLVHYRGNRKTVGGRAILRMKRQRNMRAFRFFADQLFHPISRYMKEKGLGADKVCFCYVPRSRHSVSHYGFDQAECLCRMLAKRMGAPFLPLFRRKGRSDPEQKLLSARERVQNAKLRFSVCDTEIPNGVECLFLVDDVITTGASTSACAALLKGQFLGAIVGVSLARTPLTHQKAVEKG
jgi:predicted amidophosphoribosyltransferase